MINRITDNKFKLVSKYQPSGDQPQAIEQLVDNIEGGEKAQILMGATGTGKTYTMSQVIAQVNKPTLVIAHNKTLAGQLYRAIPISKKIARSMMRLTSFVTQQPPLF